MSAPAEVVAALPQYAIGEEIGVGGMGVVFAGVHRSLNRQVAIKQLPWDMVDHKMSAELFDREARVLASLDHPHIVPVYDYVRSGHESLLVMERLDGGTVYDRFHGAGVSGEQACAIGLAMLAGLHAAHNAGVLHLDVKPKNLLFTTQGVMKVADFGIAQVISEGATLVTHGGDVLGTPAYIAPEQAMGNALSPAADVYSAGTVLYELLSGELPFDNTRGAIAMMRQHMFTDPRPISNVPAPIAAVVMRGVGRELDNRYREAESFAADLAAAATKVYGQGWLERSRVPVLHLAPRVMAGLAGNGTTQPAAESRTMPVRRPQPQADHTLNATRADLTPSTPEPAQSVLWLRLGAVLAFVALFVLAFVTPQEIAHDASYPPLRGAAADLSKPFDIYGSGSPEEIKLELSAAGIPLGTTTASAVADAPGVFKAKTEMPAITRWIVGGTVTATLSAKEIVTQTFTFRTTQHPLASALGAGSLILGLFALAYLESGLRTVRNGHRWRGAVVGGPLLGFLFGAAVWMVVSTLTGHEPSAPFGVGCGIAGAVGAILLVFATRRRHSA